MLNEKLYKEREKKKGRENEKEIIRDRQTGRKRIRGRYRETESKRERIKDDIEKRV